MYHSRLFVKMLSLTLLFILGVGLTVTPAPARADASGKITFFSDRDGNREIYIMEPNGTSQTRLTNHPALDDVSTFNREGSKICFTSGRDGNLEVYVMNADGSASQNVTNHSSADFYGTFSPDGTRMAFTSTRTGNDVFVMNANGSNPVQLTSAPGVDDNPRFSPDGQKIVFVSNRDGNFELYSMNVNGSGQRRLTNSAGTDYAPVFSPDGTKIAFASNRDGNLEIYTINADGTNPTRITNNPADDDHPSFSPDGTRIVFHSYRDGNPEIYVMNANGSSQTRLTNSPGDDRFPYWGPDYNAQLPVLSISDATVAEGNSSGTIFFTIQASGTITEPITVRFTTTDGTATAGSDYVAGSGNVTLTAENPTAQIPVQVIGDRVPESSETFFITLSSPTGANLGRATGVGTLRNDDSVSIQGRIATSSGAAVGGVSVVLAGGTATQSTSVLTNSAGYYSFANVQPGDYSITPSKSGYRFTPTFKSVTVGTTSVSGQNFLAATGYNVSGRVANTSGIGLANISVRRSGWSTPATTNSAGYYTFTDVPNGSVTIQATGNGLSFSPESRTLTVNGADVAGQNFIAAPGYNLIGRITISGGPALSGVRVTRSGSSAVAFTNSAGYFVFSNVANGSYTITPQLSSYNFTPSSRTVSVKGADTAGNNFLATSQ